MMVNVARGLKPLTFSYKFENDNNVKIVACFGLANYPLGTRMKIMVFFLLNKYPIMK
jgi:hypothetical protein